MKKFLIIGIALLVLGGIGALVVYNMDWGGRTSTVEKTEVVEAVDSTDAAGNVLPSMDDLSGVYAVSTETGKAELLFEIDGLKETKGAFEEFETTLDVAEDFTSSKLEVRIQAASLNTENEMRDEHLREAEYFDVHTHPEILFTADAISFDTEKYSASGALNFLGNEQEMTINFDHIGGQDVDGKHIEVFEGNFEFDRTAYGMKEESGIGNIVTISFYVELEQK